MAYHSFEDLEVWKRATRLSVDVYKSLAHCRDPALRDQMTRAAVSIASNIAEGAERDSVKDFVRFLNIAKGSAAELRTQAYIAHEIGVIPSETRLALVAELKQISAMLHALVKSLRADTDV